MHTVLRPHRGMVDSPAGGTDSGSSRRLQLVMSGVEGAPFARTRCMVWWFGCFRCPRYAAERSANLPAALAMSG
jgi:hypothetical protein